MIVLSIHGPVFQYVHNSSASLLIDGEVIASVEEERFDKKKYSDAIPLNAIRFCLEKGKIDLSMVDIIVFPCMGNMLGHSSEHVELAYRVWAKDDANYTLKNFLEILELYFGKIGPKTQLRQIPHYYAHAASAFFSSPFETSAVLVVDGSGEHESASLFTASGNSIIKVHDFLYDRQGSIGTLYSSTSAFLGFRGYGGSGKTMGLAAFGKVRPGYFERHITFTTDILRPVKINDHCLEHISVTNSLGKREYCSCRSACDPLEQCHYDVAATLQFYTEEALLSLVRSSRQILPEMNSLCVAGGVMLNVNANTRIVNEAIYESIHFTPAANDGGLSLGAAWYIYHDEVNPESRRPFSVYLGPHAEDDFDTTSAINKYSQFINAERIDNVEEDAAEMLVSGEIIGWMQGRMEWGPRALGNRSILANPLLPNVKTTLDSKVKVRERFRPYAASVLAEEADKWFHLPASPHMLLASQVHPQVAPKVPGIVHADGTCRPQVVFKHENRRYHKLLTLFHQKTGCPLLLNTSFNMHNEPIINTPEDAIADLLVSGLDAVYVGHYKIRANRDLLPPDIQKLPLAFFHDSNFLDIINAIYAENLHGDLVPMRLNYVTFNIQPCDISCLSEEAWAVFFPNKNIENISYVIRKYIDKFLGYITCDTYNESKLKNKFITEYSYELLNTLQPDIVLVPKNAIVHFFLLLDKIKPSGRVPKAISSINQRTIKTIFGNVYPLSYAHNLNLAIIGYNFEEFSLILKPYIDNLARTKISCIVDIKRQHIGEMLHSIPVVGPEDIWTINVDGFVLCDVEALLAQRIIANCGMRKTLFRFIHNEVKIETIESVSNENIIVWHEDDTYIRRALNYLENMDTKPRIAGFVSEGKNNGKIAPDCNETVYSARDINGLDIAGILIAAPDRTNALRVMQAHGYTGRFFWCPDELKLTP